MRTARRIRDEGMLKVTDYPLAMALLDREYLKSFEDYYGKQCLKRQKL
jgi:hypothetical protein